MLSFFDLYETDYYSILYFVALEKCFIMICTFFQEIEGIETLTKLDSLYVGKNKITKLKGLDTLLDLKILSIQVRKNNLTCTIEHGTIPNKEIVNNLFHGKKLMYRAHTVQQYQQVFGQVCFAPSIFRFPLDSPYPVFQFSTEPPPPPAPKLH